MPQYPVFQALYVEGYELYPGTEGEGLRVRFQDGLTMLLGANGLGKTTFVTILHDLLTGPTTLQGLSSSRLGDREPEVTNMTSTRRRTFGARVNDGAKRATATVVFRLHTAQVKVRRRLDDLSLELIEVDGNELTGNLEPLFRATVSELAQVNTFAEWQLLLELLIFFKEDRRSLVWDTSAQLQILRILFLPLELSSRWAAVYGKVLSLDSLTRNIRFALNAQAKLLDEKERKSSSGEVTQERLATLQETQAGARERQMALEETLNDVSLERQHSRLALLRAEQTLEGATRDLEHSQLRRIESVFPSMGATSKYILGQLMVEEQCLVCGESARELASTVRARISEGNCPVCGSTVTGRNHDGVAPSLEELTDEVAKSRDAQVAALARKRSAEIAYQGVISELAELNATIAARDSEISELVALLPPDMQEIRAQQDEVRKQRTVLEQTQARLAAARMELQLLQNEANVLIATRTERIQTAFKKYASDFLLERCDLAWSTYMSRVGQEGPAIELPSFELDLSGASFSSPVRRSGPNAVSESQREFIDLSFKMALMAVSSDGPASLIVDAPESSLDAVFVSRAADVLMRFASEETGNRLIVTSNLIEGDLAPHLLSWTPSPEAAVVDLLQIAAPTAAIRMHRQEYEGVRRRVIEKAQGLKEQRYA